MPVNINNPGAQTFSQLKTAIEQNRNPAQSLRAKNTQEGTQLYTHRHGKTHSLLNSFGARFAKRKAGADVLKAAIDREYGAGMGARVFRRMNSERSFVGKIFGSSFNNKIKQSDLSKIQTAINKELVLFVTSGTKGGPKEALKNDQFKNDFLAFCGREFSSENPLFLIAINNFDSLQDGGEIRDALTDLARITVSGALNISNETTQDIRGFLSGNGGINNIINLGDADANTLADLIKIAGNEINKLTANDTAPRFLRSDVGQKYT